MRGVEPDIFKTEKGASLYGGAPFLFLHGTSFGCRLYKFLRNIAVKKSNSFMTVYVVSGNEIEKGQFQAFHGETVHYMTEDGMKAEHSRNVFFNRRNARYHLVRSLGIFRPILNGTKQ